jgi:hypothetical protein
MQFLSSSSNTNSVASTNIEDTNSVACTNNEESSSISQTITRSRSNENQNDMMSIRNIVLEGLAPFDILCGKERTYEKYKGNQLFRAQIAAYTSQYQEATSREKMRITKLIIYSLKTKYQSRFLRLTKNGPARYWEEISDRQARDKTSHALCFAATSSCINGKDSSGSGYENSCCSKRKRQSSHLTPMFQQVETTNAFCEPANRHSPIGTGETESIGDGTMGTISAGGSITDGYFVEDIASTTFLMSESTMENVGTFLLQQQQDPFRNMIQNDEDANNMNKVRQSPLLEQHMPKEIVFESICDSTINSISANAMSESTKKYVDTVLFQRQQEILDNMKQTTNMES